MKQIQPVPTLLGVPFLWKEVGKQVNKASGNDYSDGKMQSKVEGRIWGIWAEAQSSDSVVHTPFS